MFRLHHMISVKEGKCSIIFNRKRVVCLIHIICRYCSSNTTPTDSDWGVTLKHQLSNTFIKIRTCTKLDVSNITKI